ncbi:MAG: helix-turn-helix domain-containing protein [Candidatus Cloacimonetes bacterium]|jgi:DNA invertase Pin-like site-specific DNA recombinase|nr:helix-turn-helix domain-containing protein [Candidatus Cloacimonadota bacterium]MDD2230973.1 helix-turn-helix domain-containing protein [Candidatus Cloacimonadota bacterium]
MAGLASARARGKVGGRKKALDDQEIKMLLQLSQGKTISIANICRKFKISKATYYKYLRNNQPKEPITDSAETFCDSDRESL